MYTKLIYVMIRIQGHALLCAFVALSMLLILQPASAQNFYADFEDGIGVNNPAQWVPDNPGQQWAIADFPGSGKGLQHTTNGCSVSGNTPLPGVTNFKDGIIQLDMSWGDDDSWGVVFRKTADNAGYLVVFGYVEFPAVIVADLADCTPTTGMCLDEINCENNPAKTLIQVPHGLGAGLTQDLSVSYTGRIEAKGETIRVWYLPTADIADPLGDLGNPLVEIQHGAHAGPGSVGVWQESNGNSMIDNVMVIVGDPAAAGGPSPADTAVDVPRDVVLSWTPGMFAPPINGHKVFLSENFNDVNDGIGGITQDANSYTPPQILDFGTTYYWRVDEVNGPPDYTVYEGEVWSFTTEPVGYPIENIIATASSSSPDKGPENIVNGAGLDDSGLLHSNIGDLTMWLSGVAGPQPTWIEFQFDKVYKLHELLVWNSNETMEPVIGFGLKDVTIEYSTNGTDYTTLGTTHQFARAPGTPDYAHNTTVDLGGVLAEYVKLTANSNWGGILPQFGLSEVRFLYIPVRAREPIPDSGATDVDLDVILGFRAGREAAKHDVYFGTDQQVVVDGTTPVNTVTENSYGPLSLDLDMTYYWKINEVNEAESPPTWQGDLWSFSTLESLVVDDFESYNNIDPPDPKSHRIFESWSDGFGVATNGALVGNDFPPYLETTIVHGGKQSVPVFYSNTAGAASSEITRTFAPGQDWTKHGIATLVLYFYGNPGNTGQLYVKVNGSKVVYDGDATDIGKPLWQQWNIDLASLGAGLQNVTKLAIGIDGNGAAGTLLFDDIRLYRLVPEPPLEIWFEAEAADSITEPMKIYPAAGIDPVKDAGGAGLPSGGLYIGTTSDVPGNNDNPGTQDIATYTFTVPAGTYAIWGRVSNVADDSLWVHIPDGQYDVPVHSSGWIRWNSIDPETADWHWVRVHSDDAPGNAVVNVTLTAGQHTILWAHRESQNFLDAFVITEKLD